MTNRCVVWLVLPPNTCSSGNFACVCATANDVICRTWNALPAQRYVSLHMDEQYALLNQALPCRTPGWRLQTPQLGGSTARIAVILHELGGIKCDGQWLGVRSASSSSSEPQLTLPALKAYGCDSALVIMTTGTAKQGLALVAPSTWSCGRACLGAQRRHSWGRSKPSNSWAAPWCDAQVFGRLASMKHGSAESE
jgi:hypothetical protein